MKSKIGRKKERRRKRKKEENKSESKTFQKHRTAYVFLLNNQIPKYALQL